MRNSLTNEDRPAGTDKFIIDGDLKLSAQEGGLACDAFLLELVEPEMMDYTSKLTRLMSAAGPRLGSTDIAGLVKEHFGASYDRWGDARIGKVRITIEKIE